MLAIGGMSVHAPDFNIGLLREYVTLAQVLNFTKAASMLNMSQAVLSKHLARLESGVGKRLIERSTSPVEPAVLTEAGRAFLANAYQVVSAYDGAFGSVGSQGVSVSIGGHYHHATIALATQVIQRYHAEGMAFSLLLNKRPAISTDEMFANDRSDVLVVMVDEGLDMHGLASRPLFKDRLCACLPAGHRLAEKPRLMLDDFKDETFIVASGYAQYDNWPYIRRMCERHGFMPKTRFLKIDSNDDFLCTDTFDAVYFIPAYTLRYHVMLQPPSFSCRILEDEDCFFDYRVAWRPSSCTSEAARFIDDLLAIPLDSLAEQGPDLTIFR